MKKERIRSKHGFKGLGSFILGWFVGFICTLLILFGVGYWAYTSISVKRIEKWTNSNITDNEGVEKLTLSKAMAIVQGIASNDGDAYTIAKLEEDFGVNILGDSIYGISTDIIKNSPIKELKQALSDTIDTATFNNVLSFMDVDQDQLGLLDTVLESEVTYYISNGKLYTNEECTIEVDFDYEINGDTVEFSNGSHTIASNKIHPRFRDLPLTTAMNSMTEVTHDLKIYEVMDYTREGTEGNYIYKDGNVEVTGIMASLAEYSVGDLSDSETFDNLYIYEVMGYEQVGTAPNYTYKDGNADVTGIMSKIAGKTLGQLSEDDAFDDITVADAMGYHYDSVTQKWYKSTIFTTANEVTGVIKHLAGSNMKGLSTDVQALTVGKILDVEESDATGVIKALHASSLNTLKADIENLTLGSALGVTEAEATGVIKTFYNTKITDLNDSIKDIKIWQAMGYYEKDDNGVKSYYLNYNDSTKEYSNPVTGMMATLAPYSVNDLSNSDTFNNLYIYEVVGYTQSGTAGNYTYTDKDDKPVTGVMTMLADAKIGEISSKVDEIINKTKLSVLFEKGVIDGSGLKTEVKAYIGTMTIPELMTYINNNLVIA